MNAMNVNPAPAIPATADAAAQSLATALYKYVQNEINNLKRVSRNLILALANLTTLDNNRTSLGVTSAVTRIPGQMVPGNQLNPATNNRSNIASNILTYLGKASDNADEPWSVVKQVGVGAAKRTLLDIGRERFNSAVVRNLTYVTNIYRLVRAKMEQDLSQQRTVIQRGDALVSRTMTEFGSDAQHGPDEVQSSRRYFSERDVLFNTAN